MVAFFHGLLLYFFTYVVCNVTVIIMCVMVVLGLSKTGQEVVGMKRLNTKPSQLSYIGAFYPGLTIPNF